MINTIKANNQYLSFFKKKIVNCNGLARYAHRRRHGGLTQNQRSASRESLLSRLRW